MINRFRNIGIIALAPYLVLSQSAYSKPAGSSDILPRSRLLIAEAKTSTDARPALSGIRLLSEIFKRLRDTNQLALNNPTKQLVAATQAFQGSLNPLLAIRPSEKSLNKTGSLIAYGQADKRTFANRQESFAASSNSVVSNEAGSGGQIKEYARRRNAAVDASSNALISSLQKATLAAPAAPAPAPVAGRAASSTTSAPTDNLSDAATSGPQDNKTSKPAMRFDFAPNTIASRSARPHVYDAKVSSQNTQMLARSVSNLMQSTKQLSELSQATDSPIRTYGKAKRDLRDDRMVATLPGGPMIQEYSANGATKISGTKDLMSMEPARNADAESENSAPLMTPDQPGQYRIVRNQLLALLPPSVVSGIPLARLGATEQELAPTLSKKTGAYKQKIDDWTVWTIKGPDGHSTAVQLYMRHSVVEAIRVFQPFYLGEEVGIRIGDDLATIKKKFGEPALILPEPEVGTSHSSSQNYVYPISHVAFQLVLPKSQPLPKVVSVLIFDMQ